MPFIFFWATLWCSGITPVSTLQNLSWHAWGTILDPGLLNPGLLYEGKSLTHCTISLFLSCVCVLSVQDFLLALCSGIIPCGAQGIHITCEASGLICYSVSLVPADRCYLQA